MLVDGRTRRTAARTLLPAIMGLLLAGALLASCSSNTNDLPSPATQSIPQTANDPAGSTDAGDITLENGEVGAAVAPIAASAPAIPTGFAFQAKLESATYLAESTDPGKATLENGEFREPIAPDSAGELVIQLGKWTLGDLDRQGGLDAAAITVEHPGGTGTFFYLHALVDEEGTLRDADIAFLGDRILIQGVSIHDGAITVALLDRAPGSYFIEPPSIPVIRRFALQEGMLVEVNGGGTFACDTDLPDASMVIVRSPNSGNVVTNGFAVSGCSRTFESNVNWQLLDRTGKTIAEGFAMGGGVDGPGEFSFTVIYESAERQFGHLKVFEADVSEGIGFPPPRDIVPVVLSASG